MSKLTCVNALVSSTEEYFRNKSDMISEMLLRHLQDLSVHHNTVLYDYMRNDATRLYMSLHQLISNLEPSSQVLWAAVRVFEKCCINFGHSPLFPQQKFISPVIDLLLTDLTLEKTLCILNILQELTKEKETLDKEPSIQILTPKLIEFVMTENMDVVKLSLMILVNVCHNTSIVYSLKSCIGGRFFRAVMNLQGDNISTKIQMCKLLFLLEPISLAVDGPPDISRTIIEITFSNLVDAYEKKEVHLLSEIVAFFKELIQVSTFVDLLCLYNRSHDYTHNIVRLMKGSDTETVGAVFDFMNALLSVKVPALVPIYPQIVEIGLYWLETEHICVKVLNMITLILVDMEKDNSVCNSILNLLDQSQDVFTQLYNSMEPSENEVSFVALLKLLEEMFKYDELRNKLRNAINMQKFDDISFLHSSYEDAKHCNNSILLCINVLSFLSCLARYDVSYLHARDKLCTSEKVLKMLAIGVYDDKTRCQVLQMLNRSNLPEECYSALGKSMSGQISFNELPDELVEDSSSTFARFSSFNLSKGGQVDELVKTTKQKLDNKEMKSITVSSVMSIYEYKVSAAARNEQNLYINLETARNYCTDMQQKLMALDSKIQQLRDLLLRNQQCAEYLLIEIQELEQIKEIDEVNARKNVKKYAEELSNKENMLRRRQLESKELKDKLKSVIDMKQNLEENVVSIQEQIRVHTSTANEYAAQMNTLEQESKVQDSAYIDLIEKCEVLDNQLNQSKHLLSEREAESVKLKKENSALEREIANLHLLSKAQEKTTEEKDKEIQKLQEQLSDLIRIRDLIANISGGKINSNN